MEQATELAIKQFEAMLRANIEACRQRERLEQLVRTIPPKDYDTYVRVTRDLGVHFQGFVQTVP